MFLGTSREFQCWCFQKLGYGETSTVLDFYLCSCRSPIEVMLGVSFWWRAKKTVPTRYRLHLEPQYMIEINGRTFYADFCFDAKENNKGCKSDLRLVVECDGHEFHQKTKEQASHDYERENILKLSGYDVIRFTGTQIYKDRCGCADKVIEYIRQRTDRGKDLKCQNM